MGFFSLADWWVVFLCTREHFLAIILSQIGLPVTSQGHGTLTEQRSEQADMHLFVRRVFISTMNISIYSFFFAPSIALWWVTSTPSSLRLHFCSHVFWPNLLSLQPCLVFASFVLFLSLMQYFHLAFSAFTFDCHSDLCSRTHTTHAGNTELPFSLQPLRPVVLFVRDKMMLASVPSRISLSPLLKTPMCCCYLEAWAGGFLQQLWERCSCWWKDLHLKTT